MTDTPTKLDERDEIEMLLPWYITGRLDATDKSRVEAWLARDGALARQLELIEDERRGVVQANESLALPATLSVQHSMQKIASKGATISGRLSGWPSKVRAFFEVPQPTAVRWAAAAALGLIMLQAAWIGSLIAVREPAGYATASGTSTDQTTGTFALVRFADTATLKEVSAVLAGLDMSLAGGPRAGGLYRVRIGSVGMSNDKRDARIAELKRAPGLVVLVTPTR